MNSTDPAPITVSGLSVVRLTPLLRPFVVVDGHNGRPTALTTAVLTFLRSEGFEASIEIAQARYNFQNRKYLCLRKADGFTVLLPFCSDDLLDTLTLSYIAHSEELRLEISTLADTLI